MKIGIIGHGAGIGRALRLLLESKYNDIEIIDVTKEQFEEDNKKVAIVGDPIINHFEGEKFTQKWVKTKNCKSGSNKSDRKRDRKNRWR